MIFTIVQSKNYLSKYPIGDTGDPKIFRFENKQIFRFRDLLALFQKNYILNYPLKQDVTCARKAKDLEPYIADFSEYMILDFNNVTDLQSRSKILEVFSPFRHIAFKTRSTDDIFSFNFRIVLQIPASTRSKIHKDTQKVCKMIDKRLGEVNTTLYRKAQITACGSTGLLSCNETGLLFSVEEIKESTFWSFTKDLRSVVFELFGELGFELQQDTKQQVVLKSKDPEDVVSYVWFESSPFVITSTNSGDQIDISQEFKRRYKIDDYRTACSVRTVFDKVTSPRDIKFRSFETSSLDPSLVREQVQDTIKNQGCLVLKSSMGTGKTRIIREVMAKSKSCLIVTPRVSLANELYRRLKDDGAKVYNIHKLHPDTRVYICQFDSLYKIDTKLNQFSTVIIDEFMTLCDHITSSIANNREFNISKLLVMMNKAESMMLCDAFIERNALDLIPSKFTNVHWIQNDYRDPTNIILHKDQSSFLGSMLSNRDNGIIVSCISLSVGNALVEFLQSSGFRVGLISASTTDPATSAIVQKYKEHVLDAIVYTPRVSVGVNVLGLSGVHYHYDPGNVVPVIQSIQMTRRSRNASNIEVYVKRRSRSFEPSLEEERFNVLSGVYGIGGVQFNQDGDRTLSEVGRFLAILNYHRKLWMIDTSKSFARLANSNFSTISSAKTGSYSSNLFKLSLKSGTKVDEFTKYQELDIFGSKVSYILERLQDPVTQIDDFILFERLYRITNHLEGWELCREELVQDPKKQIFNIDRELQLFEDCQKGLSAKEFNTRRENSALPESIFEKTGVFWGTTWHCNRTFLEICKYLHEIQKNT